MSLKMPEEFYGKHLRNGGYTDSTPRRWTKEEIEWCKEKHSEGYTYKEIAEAVGRTATSVSIKMKRENKKDNKYNIKHKDKKYSINNRFVQHIRPKSVLDAFSGVYDYYNRVGVDSVITNDKDDNIKADYNLDYLQFLCLMYYKNKTFDIVDLDPFGSAYDGFDLAIKMAKKGLVITLGEIGHKRFKRTDYVSRHYGINSIEDFTVDNLIKEIQRIGVRNKKDLVVFDVMEESSVARVWFEIRDLKITSQWDK